MKNRFKGVFKARLSSILITLTLCIPAYAQSAGTVKGHVSDALYGYYLEGASVTSDSAQTVTQSEGDGFYRLTLPAGSHTLTFKYQGYEPVTRTVTVADEKDLILDVSLGEGSLELSEMVVKGRLYGEMRSLNMQKAADAFKNIVSSDAIGELPDQNAAESVSRLPGVSVARDQGEGRFVVIRGIDPNLNSTSLGGIPVASPDDSDRAVLLDVIPSDIIESLSVSKTVLPDEPHDGIGGHVSVDMPSAFDKEGRSFKGTIQANHNELADKTNGRFSTSFSDQFGTDNRFGFLGAVSYDKRELASDNQEASPWELDGGNWVPTELEYREYDLMRERWGLVTNLEFRPNAGDRYFLRGNYNQLKDNELRRLVKYEVDDLISSNATGGTADFEVTNELKDREETMSEYVVSAGGKNNLDQWELDYIAGYSHSEEETPNDTEIVYELGDVATGTYSGISGYHPEVLFTGGLDPHVAANYEFDEVADANQTVEVTNWYGRINLRRDLATALPAYLKFGGSILQSERTNDVEAYVSDDNPSAFDTLEGNTGSGRKTFFDPAIPLQSANLADRFRNDPAAFAMERDVVDSSLEDYTTNEDVYAGYLMGSLSFSDMNLIAGVRVEHTDFTSDGFRVTDDGATVTVDPIRADNRYTDVLPGLHYRWDIHEGLVFRASWTNTLARPTQEQSRNAIEIDGTDVTQGNPDLDPFRSMNLDASVRYYLPNLGMIQVAAFYKDIEDFIFEQTLQGASDLGGDLTTFNNGDSGEIYGIEVGYQQQFRFLPSPLDGLGFNANITLTDSEATVPATAGQAARKISFLRQSDIIGNASVFYEKYGFSFRVAASYRDDYLDSLGEIESEDRYMDEHIQVDLSTSYAITQSLTVFADVINLNDEPLKAYYAVSGGLSQYEEYGRQFKAGVQWNF
ncbi:TonB-dependent receptor [Desulfatiferula olefinivorans]